MLLGLLSTDSRVNLTINTVSLKEGHSDSRFCPLLALHEQQLEHVFSVMIFASFMMCSQLAQVFFEILGGCKSRCRNNAALVPCATSFQAKLGMFQLFCHADCLLVLRITLVKGRALARPAERSERFEPVVSWCFATQMEEIEFPALFPTRGFLNAH